MVTALKVRYLIFCRMDRSLNASNHKIVLALFITINAISVPMAVKLASMMEKLTNAWLVRRDFN